MAESSLLSTSPSLKSHDVDEHPWPYTLTQNYHYENNSLRIVFSEL